MHSSKPILIDVDGVLADFVGKCIEILRSKFGIELDRDKATGDIRDYAGEHKSELERIISSSGFSQTFDVLGGSKEALNKLLFNGESVLFVTSPYKTSPTWSYDRQKWLSDQFGATRKDVVFARNKAPVDGKCLIDDKPENIIDWVEYEHRNEPYVGILFEQPWNRDFQHELLRSKILHTNDWNVILDTLLKK